MSEDIEKLIVLDFDGTLNSMGYISDLQAMAKKDDPDLPRPHIKPSCGGAFNKIVRETGAKILISSTWRGWIHSGHMDMFGFQRLIKSHGLRGEIVGFTRSSQRGEERWMQIRDWFRANPTSALFRRYAILDDDPGAFGGGWEAGVLTNGSTGLTMLDAERVIAILNCPDERTEA